MSSINTIHQDAQRLHTSIVEVHRRELITPVEHKAMKILEAHADAIVGLAFALGNQQDPTG